VSSTIVRRGDVVILCGPPCSGKTTFAHQHAEPGDQILDWDSLFAEMTGLPMYVQPDEHAHRVGEVFRARGRSLKRGWHISTAPTRQKRAILRDITGGDALILAVPATECLARLERSDRPAAVKMAQRNAIAYWWREYAPSTSVAEQVLRSTEGVIIRRD
jgi:5-methylcytosine-specific restriction protein A